MRSRAKLAETLAAVALWAAVVLMAVAELAR